MNQKALHLAKFQSKVGEQRLGIEKDRVSNLVLRSGLITHREPTVRAFADWVYQLDHGVYAPQSPARTKSFLREARQSISNVLDRNADSTIGSWELLSCDDGSPSSQTYASPVLSLNGAALRMRPDAVFRHSVSGLIAIIEYKIASMWVDIPFAGWPNLAAQLWAYSLADPWHNDPDVLLVAALFTWDGVSANLGETIPRTIKSDAKLFSSCAKLFEAWGGSFNPNSLTDRTMSKLLNSYRQGL